MQVFIFYYIIVTRLPVCWSEYAAGMLECQLARNAGRMPGMPVECHIDKIDKFISIILQILTI